MTDDLRIFIQNEKNKSMDFVAKARQRDGEIYLYGAGHYLRFAVQFMRKYGIKIAAILDSNRSGEYQGIPIVRFADFLSEDKVAEPWFVISAPSVRESITRNLCRYFPRDHIFSFEMEFYLDFIPDVDEYRQYLTKHWEELQKFSASLSDDKSRETLKAVLKGRISGEADFFEACAVPDQYYPKDIMCFSENEVMVELGANNGETLLEFLKTCPKYRSIYCFEPEVNCLAQLEKIRSAQARREAIHIVPKGAWDSSTVLEFFSEGGENGDAHICVERSSTPTYTIETATVDELVSEPITYLKMDIEGAELRALHGAERQIKQNKPKLAVCVYHRTQDILEIWDYLKKLVPEYHFYLRHHGKNTMAETVLYAILN